MCCDSKRNLLIGKDLLQRLYITPRCTQYWKCAAAHFIYTHSNVQQIREAIERRNQLSTKPVEAVQKLATKVATVA
jgi:Zn-finger protein